MPKANEKDAYYFPHDCNARNDPKVLALRSVYGAEGYGVYFMAIEILREQVDYRLPVTKYLFPTLALQMQCECSRVQEIIEDCCKDFALLVNDGESLYSPSLLRRMEQMERISSARREAARKRWDKESGDGVCGGDAKAQQKQSKEKNRKEDKRRAEESRQEQGPPAPQDAGLAAVMSSYLDRVNPTPSSRSLEELKGYVARLGPEVCLRAIDKALDAGKARWDYIRGILRRLEADGIRSLAQWEQQEAERERQRQGAPGGPPGGSGGRASFAELAERLRKEGQS